MEKEDVFKDVLKQDERIIKVLRPNKATFIFGLGLFLVLIIGIITLLMAVLSATINEMLYAFVGIASALVLVFVITILLQAWAYSKRYYAITNFRVIIRSGIIGVDYKSMYYVDATAVETNVSVIDKLMHQKTGTITMASASRPVVAAQGAMYGTFNLASVDDPYELAKEIQLYVDNSKNQSSKTIKENKKEVEVKKSETSIIDQIAKLDVLKQSGAISQEEYDKLKANLLKNL